MNMKKIILGLVIIALLAPVFMALAQGLPFDINGNPSPPGGSGTPQNFGQLIQDVVINGILKYVVYLIMALALVYFLAGVVKYISKQSDDSARQEARQQMIHGIIALAVMVAVWGLVNLVLNTFNLDINRVPTPPSFR